MVNPDGHIRAEKGARWRKNTRRVRVDSESQFRQPDVGRLGYTSGDEADYAYLNHGVFAYTVEAGTWEDGFDPDYKRFGEIWKASDPLVRQILETAANLAR